MSRSGAPIHLAVDDVATPDAPERLDALERALVAALSELGRVAVAFSGGVDSALVLAVATDVLGDRAVALTAVSPSLARRERAAAAALAARLGARQVEIATDELDDPRYAANDAARCYFCKDVVYRALAAHALAHDLGPLVDGMNRDDTADHRPGRRAAEALGVVSPLYDAGLQKCHVRALARRRGLPVWDKPAMACLSSRIPYGRPVTPDALARIDAAEAALSDLGLGQLRVRDHGPVARLEVPEADLPRAVARRRAIVAALRAAGFTHVALDLEGYRSGSLNASLGR